jgi:hypothetical protein
MKGLLMTIETDRGAGRHIKQLMDRGGAGTEQKTRRGMV